MRRETAGAAGHLVALGRIAIIVLLFTISPDVLITNGLQYDQAGGTPFDKLHPATWIALVLLPVMAAERGNPLTGLLRLADRHRNMLPYVLAVVFMIFYVTLVTKAPFTIFIETFLAPLVLALLFAPIGAREGRRLARILHLLIFANAVLGIYEVSTGFRLTPYLVHGEPMLDDWRSTALMGHPLANAALMGSYVMVLALGGHRDLAGFPAVILGSVSLASMFAFGGRAATGLLFAGLLLIVFVRFIAILHGRRFSLGKAIATIAAVPVVALAVYTLVELGYFDRFLLRIVDDAGSASTRLEMFELFGYLNWSDLMLVPDKEQIATWVAILGLEYGIENFIVSFILSYGIVATVIFVSALLLFWPARDPSAASQHRLGLRLLLRRRADLRQPFGQVADILHAHRHAGGPHAARAAGAVFATLGAKGHCRCTRCTAGPGRSYSCPTPENKPSQRASPASVE